ncbi:MAG: AraC family transcriptional regulator [Eubacteriales bacterium]|nr:AraC family transcriptional regulator [Eubacteriales bacterium]
MMLYYSCRQAIEQCLATQTFAVAHLYNDEKPMSMHIHDSYELYFSISGGKQFLIDNRFYSISPGDLFFINQYESHHLTQIDSEVHERIVLSVHPEFIRCLSSEQTNLNHCFSSRPLSFGHRISLTEEEQKRFLYYIHKLSSIEGYGADLMERAVFTELMVFLNAIFLRREQERAGMEKKEAPRYYPAQVDEILTYINQNIQNPLTIEGLSEHFFLSSSYLCRIFKSATGTTINKYVTARRITLAKAFLSEGRSVNEACELCGFQNYSNFLKAFTRAVGISPKKYSQFTA